MDVNARLTTLTRVGFATRGLLYIVIALLVIRAGRAESASGALRYLGEGGGRVLLVIMAAGLFAYSLWRLADAAFGIERHEATRKGAIERLGAAASGVTHLLLAWQAVRLIRGAASAGDGTQEGAQTALQLPGGGTLVIAAGLVLLGVGAFQLVKAVKGQLPPPPEPAGCAAALGAVERPGGLRRTRLRIPGQRRLSGEGRLFRACGRSGRDGRGAVLAVQPVGYPGRPGPVRLWAVQPDRGALPCSAGRAGRRHGAPRDE